MEPLFVDFAGQWTPVGFARELGRRPLPVRIAGERVVLWRTGDAVSAALDRCPHRGVQLSLGAVRDGCLECPFHGWRFGPDGACTHVPYNPGASRDRLGLVRLPTREVGGLLWVFTRPGAEASEPLEVPDALLRTDTSRFDHAQTWACHWTRAMENMLDYPHLPFVHWNTIGAGARRRLGDDAEAVITFERTAHGAVITPQQMPGAGGRLTWYRPNGMALQILPEDQGDMRVHTYCVPVDGEHTRMLSIGTRRFGRYNPLLWLGDRMNVYILSQDRAVCESHDPVEVPPPADELSVATDRPTLGFRQWYLRSCKGSHREADLSRPEFLSGAR